MPNHFHGASGIVGAGPCACPIKSTATTPGRKRRPTVSEKRATTGGCPYERPSMALPTTHRLFGKTRREHAVKWCQKNGANRMELNSKILPRHFNRWICDHAQLFPRSLGHRRGRPLCLPYKIDRHHPRSKTTANGHPKKGQPQGGLKKRATTGGCPYGRPSMALTTMHHLIWENTEENMRLNDAGKMVQTV